MDVGAAEVVHRLGGLATWSELRRLVTRRGVRVAVEDGSVIRLSRGRYGLPALPRAVAVAAAVGGTVSHTSAAELRRLPMLTGPRRVHVTVRPHAHPPVPRGVVLHWREVSRQEAERGVTSVVRTVLDCASTLPFAEGLAIADSALRAGVPRDHVASAAAGFRGRGARLLREVAAAADPRADNPFESGLRAAVLRAGLRFTPQVLVGDARVDLVDPEHEIALEADSFAWHGGREDLERDCRRYDELVRRGWTVLRFAWEHVVLEPEWVTGVVTDVWRSRATAGEESARRRAAERLRRASSPPPRARRGGAS